MTEWSIELNFPHQSHGDFHQVEERLEDLLDHLKGRAAVGAYDAQVLSIRFNVKAPQAAQAMTLALTTLDRALKKLHWPLNLSVIRASLETIEALDRRLQVSNVPELVGVTEVAAILDVTKQRASELAKDRRFPKPVATLASGPVWNRHAVARFLEQWPRRRSGRPKKTPVAVG